MNGFGDFEPEDAFDATDPVDAQLDNILRRIWLVVAVARLRRRLSGHDTHRLELIAEDLNKLANRG